MLNFALHIIRYLLVGVLLWLTAPHSFSQSKQEVYARINEERQKAGMQPIQVDSKLERSAQWWSFWMPSSLKHNTHFLKRFRRTGAECLTAGDDPVSSWMKSKPHRQSIMGKGVTAMGLGYWRGKWVWRSFTN